MGLFDKVKSLIGMGAGAATGGGVVSSIAGAVGGVGNAVAATATKADHAQMLEAGQAQGKLADVEASQKNIAAGADARADKRVRDDVDKTRYLD